MDEARTLQDALARMRWEVEPGAFVLAGFAAPPGPEDLAALGDGPGQIVREGGETTLLVPAERLAALRARHPDLRVEEELVWIRFVCPMGWELVGFLALVTARLAEAGVPLGAVCGFSRDHLFVARRHEAAARAALAATFPEEGPSEDAEEGPEEGPEDGDAR